MRRGSHGEPAMIDVMTESLVPLKEVPRLLPPRDGDRPIHISAVYRWVQRGVRGKRLESVRIGGTTYTSREALQRFAETKDDPARAGRPAPTPRRRQRQIEAASLRVRELLG